MFDDECPFCDSEDISGDMFDSSCGYIHRSMWCNRCGTEWTNIYKFESVENIREGVLPEEEENEE